MMSVEVTVVERPTVVASGRQHPGGDEPVGGHVEKRFVQTVAQRSGQGRFAGA